MLSPFQPHLPKRPSSFPWILSLASVVEIHSPLLITRYSLKTIPVLLEFPNYMSPASCLGKLRNYVLKSLFASRIHDCELDSANQMQSSVRFPFKSEWYEDKATSWDHFCHRRTEGLATVKGSSGGQKNQMSSWAGTCLICLHGNSGPERGSAPWQDMSRKTEGNIETLLR